MSGRTGTRRRGRLALAVAGATTGIGGAAAAPAETVLLRDDTGRIQIVVPAAWADRETAPQMADDGRDRPRVAAAPDLAAVGSGWNDPGVWIGVVPAPAEPADWLAAYAFDGQCTRGPSTEFDNGALRGTQEAWTECGGGTTQIVQVGARAADGTGVFVQLQTTTPDDPLVAVVLGSVATIADATATSTATQPAGAPSGSAAAWEPESAAPVIAVDAERVADDTGRLALTPPAGFSELTGGPGVNDDASLRPMLAAAPDLEAYYSTWHGAGIEAVLLPPVDAATLLANRPLPCDDGGVRRYSDGRFDGLLQTWNACGGTATRVVQVALTPLDRPGTILVHAQVPDADPTPLATVLASLELR